jgi:hypothetical protein
MVCRVALVGTDVSEELSASFIKVTRICELGAMLAVTSVVPSSPILVTLMKEAQVPPKRRFLQEPHGVTSQKTPFFIIFSLCNFGLNSIAFKSYDSAGTKYRLEDRRAKVPVLEGSEMPLFHVQPGSGVHPVSYPVSTGCKVTGTSGVPFTSN